MGFGLSFLGTAATGLASGLLGSSAEKKARRLQEQYINRSLGAVDDAVAGIDAAESRAQLSLDEANLILGGIEEAVLAGMDESLRIRVAEQVRAEQAQTAALNQQLSYSGLDATTAGAGIQRGQAFGRAQRLASVGAGYAGQRGAAIQSARTGLAQGLANKANMTSNFAAQRSNAQLTSASILSGVQIQPSNMGANVGQLGAGLLDAFQTDSLLAALRGGGTGLAPGQSGPFLPPGYNPFG